MSERERETEIQGCCHDCRTDEAKMKRQENERREQSEARRKTDSVKKVEWEVKEKSATNWSWMTGSKCVYKKDKKRGSLAGLSSSEASWLL